MKAKFLTIAMAIFVGTFVTSCDKNDDNTAAPSAGISSTNSNDGTDQAPDQAAGRVGEDQRIGGVYQVAKFANRGENMTNLYSGVKFNFSDNNVLYASSQHFNHKGIWGVDMNSRMMKINIQGNDLMNMVSGSYRITNMTADGMVYLVNDDGTKSLVFQKRGSATPYTGTAPKVVLIPGRR